jgi:hypothetical protein
VRAAESLRWKCGIPVHMMLWRIDWFPRANAVRETARGAPQRLAQAHRKARFCRVGPPRRARRDGITVLFVGSCRTGKTMAAEIVASEFRLTLLQDFAGGSHQVHRGKRKAPGTHLRRRRRGEGALFSSKCARPRCRGRAADDPVGRCLVHTASDCRCGRRCRRRGRPAGCPSRRSLTARTSAARGSPPAARAAAPK